MKNLKVKLYPLLVFAISLIATYLAWQNETQTARRDLQSILDFQLHQTISRIEQRMASYEEIARGIQGLTATTDDLQPADFTNYVKALRLGADFSGLQAIELTRLVPADQADDFVRHMRQTGHPDFHIWPEGKRSVYAPVTQIEPTVRRNPEILGYDPYADAPRRQAMEQARESGLITLSGKMFGVLQTPDNPEPGFLLVLPIFKKGAQHESALERRENTVGWILCLFRMNDLMASLYGEGMEGIVIEIFDGVVPSFETRLFPSNASAGPIAGHRLSASEFVVIAGHNWTVSVCGTPTFETLFGRDKSTLLAFTGIGVGLLLTLVSWQMATAQIRAQRIAETMTRELKESEECWKFALEGAGDGVWDWHIMTGELRYSERWKEILGHDENDQRSGLERWISHIHPDDLPAERASLQSCLAGTAPIYLSEHRIRWIDGNWRWMSVRGMVVSRDSDGMALRMIGTISDISERRATEEKIRHMAQHDPLTNLPNRILFSDRLHLAIARAKRDQEMIALMFVDLDHFKPVNDLHGHDIGDLLLREVSSRMRQSIRNSDTVARIGGDEFVVLLPSIGAREDAFQVAEKLRQSIGQPYDLAGRHITISSSVGVALFPEDGGDALTLSKNADDAMYHAKQAGRDKVEFYCGGIFSPRPTPTD